MLVGRTAECSRLRSLLAGAQRGQAGALLLRGEVGIGKTCLLDYTVRTASGFQILRASGHEAETGLTFAALSWLLDPLTGQLPELPAAQESALTGALQLGPAAGGDRLAVAAATLTLLAKAADAAPTLVAVDDAHLLDLPSLEALVFTVRRLKAERIAVVLTARPPDETSPDIARWLDWLPLLPVGALDEQESRQLLAAHGGVSRSVVDRRIEETGGNPLALLEFPRIGIGPQSSPVAPLPISRRLELAFGKHILDQPQTTRQAMLLLAAAGAAASDVLVPALSRQGLSAEDLEPAETAGLLVIEHGQVWFRHPLVRSALYQSASPAERRATHRVLADVFGGQRSARASERRGWHLAEATIGQDEKIASELDFSAYVAAERRSYATAMELYSWAAQLSEPGVLRAGRLMRAAHASVPAGRIEAGLEFLQRVLEETDDERTCTEARHLRCRTEMWRGRPVVARDMLLAEAERIQDKEPLWSAYMRANAALVSTMIGELQLASSITADAVKLVTGVDDAAAMPVLLMRAFTHSITGDVRQARSLLERCEPHLEDWDPLDSEQLLLVAALAWESLEEPGQAHRWLSRAVQSARDASAVGLLPFQLSWLAMAEWRAGRWAAAFSHGHDAIELAIETGWHTELPNSLVVMATVEAGRGDGDECRHRLARAVELGTQTGTEAIRAFASAVLGLLELGEGRPDAACLHLEAAGRFAAERELGDPVLLQWAGNLVEARVRTGQPERAAEPFSVLTAEAARTERPTELAIAARCRGLLAAASQEADDAFAEALDWHSRASRPFEEARTWLCHGEFLRRQRRRTEARAALERAAGQFEQLGARSWAERARGELRATGVTSRSRRDPGTEGLTPQEMQVALVVAEGATNAEAAAQMFLSPKTIEYHLSSVYRKLGLRSRGQLARAMRESA